MATIRKVEKNKLTRTWRIWNPLHYWWGAANVVMLELPYTLAISLLEYMGIHTQELKAGT